MIPSPSAYVCLFLGARASAKDLPYPKIWDADENPKITIDFDWVDIDPGFGGTPFKTRALGGSVPGPTIKLSAGTILRVKFRNLLEAQHGVYQSSAPHRLNRYNDPDTGNLHFHGGHVSSVLPADDTTLVVPPGEQYDFVVPFPEDHMPGIHWVHPHHHGSSSLHLVGGAALALIVKDPPGYLPSDIQDAKEVIMVFQDWDVPRALVVAKEAGDAKLQASFQSIEGGEDIGQRFVTVNGIYQPTVTITRGVWERWRIVYAGWQDLSLDLAVKDDGAECEFNLLAKDGVYVKDYPRPITKNLPVPPGGRADLMVRCNNVGTTKFSALSRDTMTLVSKSSAASAEDSDGTRDSNVIVSSRQANSTVPLVSWSPANLPDYLQTVQEVPATPGCSCSIKMDGYDDTSRINGEMYRPGNNFMHTSFLGAVVERQLTGMHKHSYHQHIYPFQLVSGFQETEYFHLGDWHDSLLDKSQQAKWLIRYQTTNLPGKMMVHCHNAKHADQGMLAKEYIRDVGGDVGTCVCDHFGPISGQGIIDDVENVKVAGERSGAFHCFDTSPVVTYLLFLLPVLLVGV